MKENEDLERPAAPEQEGTETQAPETGAEPRAVASEEVQLAKRLLRAYGLPVLAGIAVAILVPLGISLFRSQQQAGENRAFQTLFSVNTGEEFQQLASQYAKSKAAPIALLAAASHFFQNGRYDMAQVVYNQFQQQYAQHPLAPAAELGLAQCLEATGQLEPARDRFTAFLKANETHFMAPLAILGQARCLEKMGRLDDAETVYQNFMQANPESPWVNQARTGLLYLDQHRRALKAGITSEPAAAAAPAVVETLTPAATPAGGPGPAPASQPGPAAGPAR